MTLNPPESDEGLALRIVPTDPSVAELLDRVEAYGTTIGLPPRQLYLLALVCEELGINVVRHGAGRASFFAVTLRRLDQELRIRIEDDGPFFDPLSRPAPALDNPLDETNVGGLGIHLVKRLARDLRFERINGCNRLDLVLGPGDPPVGKE